MGDPAPDLRPVGARLLAGAALSAIALLAVFLVAQSVLRSVRAPPPRAADTAPAFTLDRVGGGRITLASLRGRVVLLDFGTITCAGCVAATPKLNRLHARFGARGLSVVSVNQDDRDAAAVAAFIERRRIQYPVVLDDGTVSSAYGLHAFPAAVLIDPSGTIRAVHVGAVTEEKLDAEIRALLDEGLPSAAS